MANEIETRALDVGAEVRAHEQAGGGHLITGYAAVFNSLSEDLGGFREIIRPGAFKETLAGEHDIRGLVNHEPTQLLGRTASGTMRLKEDRRGLKYDIDAPKTTAAADVVESIQRGDMSGSSFSFRVRGEDGENWTDGEGSDGEFFVIRELLSLDVMDVGPVTFPAYSASVAETTKRSLDKARKRASLQADQARLDNLKSDG